MSNLLKSKFLEIVKSHLMQMPSLLASRIEAKTEKEISKILSKEFKKVANNIEKEIMQFVKDVSND